MSIFFRIFATPKCLSDDSRLIPEGNERQVGDITESSIKNNEKIMITNYTPQPRTKLQFARLFVSSDDMNDRAALRWLQKEINSNPHLLTMLQAWGYNTNSHMLTIMQQGLIYDHLCVKSNDRK